jgi:type IV secretion system protein VirD4
MTGYIRAIFVVFSVALGFVIWLLAYGLGLNLVYGDPRILHAMVTTTPLAPVHQLTLYAGNTALLRVALWAVVPAITISAIVSYFGMRPASNPLGDAHFQTLIELRRGAWFRGKGHILGRFGRRILRVEDERHHLVIGPTRSGKGACYVIPNALNHQGSMVVTDLKGEIFRSTAGFRKAKGNQVFLFAPGSDRTHRYNPLDFIRSDRGERTIDIQNIAGILIPESVDSENSIWQATAQQVMAGAISYVHESVHYRDRRNLGEVTAFFNTDMNLQMLMALVRDKEPGLSRFTIESFNAYIALSERAAASALLDIQKALRPFRNERVVAATCATDMDLRALKFRPISIYLAPNITDITLLRPLLALFVQQTLDTILLEAEPRPLPIYFLLDEFRQLKKLNEITNKLPYVAGYNVKMAFIIQDLKNLDEIYGETARQSLTGNCGYQLVLGANDQATAEAVSKSLGRQTVRYVTESKTIELMGLHRRTKVEQLRARDLMMPQEVRQLASEKMIVLVEGQNPILADKLRFFSTSPFREYETYSRGHVPSVPMMEFLPPRAVPATTTKYTKSNGPEAALSAPDQPAAISSGTSVVNIDEHTSCSRSIPTSAKGPQRPTRTAQMLEARFDLAAARLKRLVAAKSETASKNWSAIFDQTVPDSNPDQAVGFDP